MTEHRKEFPIKVEYEAYIFPVVGFFFLASVAAAVVVCSFMMTIGAMLHLPDSIAMLAILGTGVTAVVLWVTHLRRVHTGRKIVLDDDGITYFHFADDKRFIAWDTIDECKIMDGTRSDASSHTEIYVGNQQKLKFQHSDFDSGEILNAVRNRIPNKIKEIEF